MDHHLPERFTWVFIHGAGSNRDVWLGQQPAFPGAQMLDLPGHGAARRTHGPAPAISPPLPEITVAAYADWIAGLIDAGGWADVILVGHSMGGAIALELGLRRPAWLRGLVLTNTGARLRVAPSLFDLLEHDYPAAVDWVIEHEFAPGAGAYRREGTRRQMLRTAAAVTLADFRACDAFDGRAALQEGGIRAPALVLGAPDDQMTPPKHSEFLAGAIPGARLAWIPGSGHMSPLEAPEAWNAAVREWAAALPG